MAQIPTKRESDRIVTKATAEDEKKLASQEKKSKTFVNNGQGVIPEAVWKNLPGKAA